MKTAQKHGFFLCSRLAAVVAAAFALSGCLPSTGTPARLYPVTTEMEVVRTTQEELARLYNVNVFSAPAQARLIRNEIIAQRMYAVDVQYTQYENALTREGQEVNFGTLTAAGTLGTASALFTPVVTKSVLSGLSTVTLAANGHYNNDILLAQSIRTIQKQMRASRNLIAADISAKLIKSVFDYPLSAALSDVEDYYNAGTLTTGVIDASTTVGIKEANSKALKQDVTQAPPAVRAAIIRDAGVQAAPARDVIGTGRPGRDVVVVTPPPPSSGGRGVPPAAKTCMPVVDEPAEALVEFLCPAQVLRKSRKDQLVGLNATLVEALKSDANLGPVAMREELAARAKAMAASPEVIVTSKKSLDTTIRRKLSTILNDEKNSGRLVPAN